MYLTPVQFLVLCSSSCTPLLSGLSFLTHLKTITSTQMTLNITCHSQSPAGLSYNITLQKLHHDRAIFTTWLIKLEHLLLLLLSFTPKLTTVTLYRSIFLLLKLIFWSTLLPARIDIWLWTSSDTIVLNKIFIDCECRWHCSSCKTVHLTVIVCLFEWLVQIWQYISKTLHSTQLKRVHEGQSKKHAQE